METVCRAETGETMNSGNVEEENGILSETNGVVDRKKAVDNLQQSMLDKWKIAVEETSLAKGIGGSGRIQAKGEVSFFYAYFCSDSFCFFFGDGGNSLALVLLSPLEAAFSRYESEVIYL